MPTSFWIVAYLAVAAGTALYAERRCNGDDRDNDPRVAKAVAQMRRHGIPEERIRRALKLGNVWAGLMWPLSWPQEFVDLYRQRKAKRVSADEPAGAEVKTHG